MTPLEAGLGGAVSLDKGCYIGQEGCLVRVWVQCSRLSLLLDRTVAEHALSPETFHSRLASAVAGHCALTRAGQARPASLSSGVPVGAVSAAPSSPSWAISCAGRPCC